MQTETLFFKRRNHLLALALSTVLVTVSGCGDDGDTANISDDQLKASLTTGLTKGVSANFTAVSKVLQDSKALQKVQTEASSIQSKSAAASKAVGDGLDFGSDEDFGMDDTLGLIDDLIAQSTINQSGNVYTFDPNESAICADEELGLDATEADKCMQLLQPMTFVVTVNATSGDEVTAADTAFKFNGTTFATTGFTPTSGFYEVDFGGLKPVLESFNNVAADEDKLDLPQTMKGKLKTKFETAGENHASITLLVPEKIELGGNNTDGDIQLSVDVTDTLLKMSANSASTTLDLEVNLNVASALWTERDDAGSFPVELALNALSGKIAVAEGGDDMRITGLGMDTITLKVDNVKALLLNMPKLDALLHADATGANAFLRLDKLLDFQLDMQNVRQYLDNTKATNSTAKVKIAAPAGTVVTDTMTTANAPAIAVTEKGPLSVEIDDFDGTQYDARATNGGACINITSIEEDTCISSQ